MAKEPARQPLKETRDPKSSKARDLYEQGQQFLRAGDRPRARAQFDLALQFEPESAAIRLGLEEAQPPHLRKPIPSLPLLHHQYQKRHLLAGQYDHELT